MRHALITSAAITTGTLWSGAAVTAVTELGSNRLHSTILTGAAVASLWLIIMAAVRHLRTSAFLSDRGYTIVAKAVLHGLLDEKQAPEPSTFKIPSRN